MRRTACYLAAKKEVSPFPTAWVDLESVMLRERSPSEKDKLRAPRHVGGI